MGATMMLSYGLVLLWLVPGALILRRRSWRTLAFAVPAAALVVAAFVPAGFWYLDGFQATRAEYAESVAATRPYGYFLVANLAALAVSIGPAVTVGLARLRDRELWWLVGPALGAVAIADLSGMSKGEVERIWLPFSVWILPAGAALASAPALARERGWLGSQGLVALAVQSLIRTRW